MSASTASSAESDFANNNTELTRLQQVYAPARTWLVSLICDRRYSLSEQKFLESAVALAGAEAAAEAAKQRKGKEAQWASLDAALLRTRIAEAQEQLNSAKQNVATHTAKTLPALCREISELQATAVLLADCEEKIARQKRYAEQHDLIVAHLQEQEARLELAARTIHREGTSSLCVTQGQLTSRSATAQVQRNPTLRCDEGVRHSRPGQRGEAAEATGGGWRAPHRR